MQRFISVLSILIILVIICTSDCCLDSSIFCCRNLIRIYTSQLVRFLVAVHILLIAKLLIPTDKGAKITALRKKRSSDVLVELGPGTKTNSKHGDAATVRSVKPNHRRMWPRQGCLHRGGYFHYLYRSWGKLRDQCLCVKA